VGANGLTPNAIGALAWIAIRDGFDVITTQRTIRRDTPESFMSPQYPPSDFGSIPHGEDASMPAKGSIPQLCQRTTQNPIHHLIPQLKPPGRSAPPAMA
jgi:hypothetical protein